MKALALLTMMLAAAPASAAMPGAEIIQDPLMIQIRAKQLTQVNGGITAAVAVKGAAKGIELELVDPLAPLAPVEGLTERPAPAKKKARPAKRAGEQAEKLEAAGQQASFDKPAK